MYVCFYVYLYACKYVYMYNIHFMYVCILEKHMLREVLYQCVFVCWIGSREVLVFKSRPGQKFSSFYSTLWCLLFSGILADDMGLGKTLEIIALILTNFEKGQPLAVPVAGVLRPSRVRSYYFVCIALAPKSRRRRSADPCYDYPSILKTSINYN